MGGGSRYVVLTEPEIFFLVVGAELLIRIAVILVFGRKIIVRSTLADFKFLFYYSILFKKSYLRGLKESQNVPEIFSTFFWLQNRPPFPSKVSIYPLIVY